MTWIACELHTHTFHSDGRQSLDELALGAKALGFDCIALTDHNTMAGLAHKEQIERETGLLIIPGMEWTTFFGHMVTIGVEDYQDWRRVGPGDIHAGLARVHEQGGLAGMAHPFRPGSPMCTGCFWEFEIRDWNEIDYIEVWSTTFAPVKKNNIRAYRLWTDKLNEGFRLAATSGRDWHLQERTDAPLSVTYLRIQEGEAPFTERAIAALSSGRASVTLGPRLDLQVNVNGEVYQIGDAVSSSGERERLASVKVLADFTSRHEHWHLPEQSYTVSLKSNLGVLSEQAAMPEQFPLHAEISVQGLLWMRSELWGVIQGVRTLIAFTNAIYFD